MSAFREGRVRVPGSTSNLGAGFDCVGMAVDRELEAGFTPGGRGLEVRRTGTLADIDATPAEDLLVRSFMRELERLGHPTVEGLVEVRSAIPVGKGLGSSAAAVVAGTALAHLVSGGDVDQGAAFRAAFREEGHGDNAAPCAFGGLRAVVGTDPDVRVLRLLLSPLVGFGFAAPPASLSTRAARDALPRTVPFELAMEGIWRTVSLIRGLAEGDGDLLARGLADRLHAPHRMDLIPGAKAAADAALAAGAWGVTVSGAGSGLLALGPVESAEEPTKAMAEALSRHHGRGRATAFVLHPALEGVRAM